MISKIQKGIRQFEKLNRVSPTQLQELPWQTKQLIFLTLLEENGISEECSMQLNELQSKRRLSRQQEKENNCDVSQRRESENLFRKSLMEIMVVEIQAYHLLLNMLESSKNNKLRDSLLPPTPTNINGVPKPIRAAREFQQAHDFSKTQADKGSTKSLQPSLSSIRHRDKSGIQPSKPLNRKVEVETKKLKERIAELERENEKSKLLYDQLVAQFCSERATIDERRVEMLKAQNFQLQRQLDLLFDANSSRKSMQLDLMSIVSQFKSIVQNGFNEAVVAGANAQNGCDSSGNQVKWMMGVPLTLLRELRTLEMHVNDLDCGSSPEIHLRYPSKYSSNNQSFTDSSATVESVHSHGLPLDISPVGHLRFNRLHQLESKLANAASSLNKLVTDILACPQHKNMEVYALSQEIRQVILDVGYFGATVCSQSVGPGSKLQPTVHNSVENMIENLPSFPASCKSLEKKIKGMLKRIQCHEIALMESHRLVELERNGLQECVINQKGLINNLAKELESMWKDICSMLFCNKSVVEAFRDVASSFTEYKQLEECQSGNNDLYLEQFLFVFKERYNDLAMFETKAMKFHEKYSNTLEKINNLEKIYLDL